MRIPGRNFWRQTSSLTWFQWSAVKGHVGNSFIYTSSLISHIRWDKTSHKCHRESSVAMIFQKGQRSNPFWQDSLKVLLKKHNSQVTIFLGGKCNHSDKFDGLYAVKDASVIACTIWATPCCYIHLYSLLIVLLYSLSWLTRKRMNWEAVVCS